MELKFRPSMEAPERAQSFNRTFMELKYLQPVTTGYAVAVLIVPLWNWNAGALDGVAILAVF